MAMPMPPVRYFDQTTVRQADLRRRADTLRAMGNRAGANVAEAEADRLEVLKGWSEAAYPVGPMVRTNTPLVKAATF